MAINPVEYHFQFLEWFSKAYPELHTQYADLFVLHLKTPVISVRKEGIEEASLTQIEKIVKEFNHQFEQYKSADWAPIREALTGKKSRKIKSYRLSR